MEDDKRRIDDLSGPVTVELSLLICALLPSLEKRKHFKDTPI